MDTIKKLFPYSFKGGDTKALVITILAYVLLSVVVSLVLGLLAGIPLIGWLFAIVRWLFGLYCLVGIVLAVLNHLDMIK